MIFTDCLVSRVRELHVVQAVGGRGENIIFSRELADVRMSSRFFNSVTFFGFYSSDVLFLFSSFAFQHDLLGTGVLVTSSSVSNISIGLSRPSCGDRNFGGSILDRLLMGH